MDHFLSILVKDHGPDRNLEDQILPVAAVAIAPHAMFAPLCLKNVLISKLDECIMPEGRFEVHVSTSPPIATAGTSPGNIFLPAKGHASGTTITGFDANFCLI